MEEKLLQIKHIRYLLENKLAKFLPGSGKYTSYARYISRLIMFAFGDNVEKVLGIPHNTENVKLSILRYNLLKDKLLVRFPLKEEKHNHKHNSENYICKWISVDKLIISPKTREEIVISIKEEIESLTNKAEVIIKEMNVIIREIIKEIIKYMMKKMIIKMMKEIKLYLEDDDYYSEDD